MTDYQPTDEVRVTSDTGGQKGQKSARFGGGDPLAYMELARVYGFGEEKYDRYNYLKGYDWSLSIDALFRHLFAFIGGEDRDPESGLLHTAHVAWHGQTLSSFMLRGVGTDDRPPRPEDEDDDDSTEPVPDRYFECGHEFGAEPDATCGTAVHWSRVNGIELRQTA